MIIHRSKHLTFFSPEDTNGLGAVFLDTGISAGFPSPADDFKEERLSLDRELIKNKEATFFARVSGRFQRRSGSYSQQGQSHFIRSAGTATGLSDTPGS